MKYKIMYDPATGDIIQALPDTVAGRKKWGSRENEQNPVFGFCFHDFEKAPEINKLRSRSRIVTEKLVDLSEEEWKETISEKQMRFEEVRSKLLAGEIEDAGLSEEIIKAVDRVINNRVVPDGL